LNPPRTGRRSMLAAAKPFDLLVFLTATKRQNPQNSADRHDSVATRLKFAARLDVAGRAAPP
jgi:hypothetical protein